jgi:Cohesin domain
MKKFLTLGLLLLSLTSFSQIKFKFPDTRVLTDIGGGVIDRGDQFDVMVHANGNSDATTRQLLFDFQYDQTNFEVISVTQTGTGGNGGILPQGSNIQLSWQNYPNYTYAGNSTFTNGTQRYVSNATYTYNPTGSNAILRATLTWATTSAMPYTSYSQILVVRFKLKATSTANSFNPVKLNFVAGWNGQGVGVPTYMDSPLSTEVIMNQNTGKYVTAKVDINSNLLSISDVKISFRDTLTNVGQLFNVLANGNVDINQSLLSENKVYEVTVMHNIDKTNAIYNGAITISDFTTAQSEFTSMGLDGSNGQILKTGQSLYAADINRNRIIDGGDLPRLLAQVVGLDTLVTVPQGYVMGSGGYMSLPTWRATDATSIAGQTEWCIVNVDGYGSGQARVYIDLRKFAGSTVLPEDIKSLQLFDLYSGPVEFVSKDASWAFYKVPSNFLTLSTSTFAPYIRAIGTSDFGLKAEFTFNPNPSNSWGSIKTTNWKDITYPKTYVKTGVLGTNEILDLKYLLWGDVNRSHSSQVVTSLNGVSTIQTNAVNSLTTNTAFVTMATNNTGFINTSTGDVSSIDVNLSNITVTSNNVEIPVTLNTNGISVGGLQFEFQYDPSKINFEELKSELPNSWYVFVNSKDGKVKFGAIDQNNKTPINGNSIPFKLKFSTIGNGVDILTSVKMSPIMDASDSKGVQLGINLNSTQIKLTGYNNF